MIRYLEVHHGFSQYPSHEELYTAPKTRICSYVVVSSCFPIKATAGEP